MATLDIEFLIFYLQIYGCLYQCVGIHHVTLFWSILEYLKEIGGSFQLEACAVALWDSSLHRCEFRGTASGPKLKILMLFIPSSSSTVRRVQFEIDLMLLVNTFIGQVEE